MNYYEDCTYYSLQHFENAKNIGWIDLESDFNKGKVQKKVIENLWEFLDYPVNIIRTNSEKVFTLNDKSRMIGFSEIRIPNKDFSMVYACPDAIIYYIQKLNYLPPKEFLDSVLSVSPNTKQYKNFLDNYNKENFWGQSYELNKIAKEITNYIYSNNNDKVINILNNNLNFLDIVTLEGSLLNVAIKANNMKIFNELLNLKIDINKFSGIELNTAVSTNNITAMEILLNKKIKMNLSSPKLNPLFVAIRNGNVDACKLLLHNNFNVEICYNNEFMKNVNALEFAKKCGQIKIIELLKNIH